MMVETVNFGGDFAFVRKNTALSDAYAGPNGAISLDTEGKNVRVHDGATQGGAFTLPSLEGMGGWPTVRPSLDLKFSAKCIDPRLVVTRASTATYFDALGNIKTASANEPRIGYDPTTGECIGLQIESAATNLLPYSDDVTNAAGWGKSNITFGTPTEYSPSGSLMTPVIASVSADTANHILTTQHQPTTAGMTYTFSFIAKAKGYTKLRVRANGDTGGYLGSLNVDISTGVVSDSSFPYTVKSLGNGFFLVSMTFTTLAGTQTTPPTTTTSCSIWLRDASGSYAFAGDGVSGVYITSTQLELGGKATSRIKTTATTATRAADVINMQGTGWLSSVEGTILADVVVDYQATGVSQSFWTLDDGSQANRMRAHIVGDGIDRLLFVANGNNTIASLSDPSAANGWHRYVAAYKENDFAAVKNGGTVNVDTSGTPPTVTQLFIGSHRGTEEFMIGHIKRLAYWPKRLTNAELKRISL